MLTIQQLCKPLTPDQVRTSIYGQLARIGVSTTNWKPGPIVWTIFAVVSVVFSSFTYWSSFAIQGMFLSLSRGDWLTAKAKYDYSTDRNIPSHATGPITLSNSGAGVYDFNPGDLTITCSKLLVDGSTVTFQYHNTGTIHVSSGSPTPNSQSITISAELEGSLPSIPPGATVSLQPPYTGLSIAVPTAITGSDEETDQALINRAQLSASAISPNGPTDAYRYVATSTLNTDASVIATKCSVVRGNPVLVYVGGPDGPITDTDALALLNVAIQTKVVPLGVTATLASGAAKNIEVTYTAFVTNTTLTEIEIKTYIQTAVQNYFATFPIGGLPVAEVDGSHLVGTKWMYNDSLKSIIERALSGIPGIINPIYHASVTTVVSGTPNGSNDIQFAGSDLATLTELLGSVTFQ